MLQNRVDYISDVNKFINKSKSLLNEVLDVLGWEKKSVNSDYLKNCKLEVCPNDNEHRIPEKSLGKHIAKCTLHKNGYNMEDVFLPPPPELTNNVIVIDEKLQNNIVENACCGNRNLSSAAYNISQQKFTRPVPQTSERLFSDLTSAERRAIYDYAVKSTSSPQLFESDINFPFNKTQDDSKPKTLEELLAAERDAKRRRIKYRSKKVHTNKKTQTEIIREVIQSQMEGYEEWLQSQGLSACNTENTEPENSFVKSSERVDVNCPKTITRHWDDWNFRYRGNPHKRYMIILQEERDTEKRRDRVDRKRSSNERNKREDCNDKNYSRRYRTKDEGYHRSHHQTDVRDKYNKEYRNDQSSSKKKRYERSSEKRRYYDDSYEQYDRRNFDSSDSNYSKRKKEYYDEDDKRRKSSKYDLESFKDTSGTYYKKHHKTKKHKHNKEDKDTKYRNLKSGFRKIQNKNSDSESDSYSSHYDDS